MIILSIGKKGTGKSANLRKISFKILKAGGVVWYHDPQRSINGKTVHTLEELGKLYSVGIPRLLVFRPPFDVEDLAREAIKFQNLTLVIDELDLCFRGKDWRRPPKETMGYTEKLIHYCRHYNIQLMGSFRATRNVNEDLLDQADFVFIHRHSPKNIYALQSISKRLGPEYAQKSTELKDLEFIVFKD